MVKMRILDALCCVRVPLQVMLCLCQAAVPAYYLLHELPSANFVIGASAHSLACSETMRGVKQHSDREKLAILKRNIIKQ